MDIAPMQDLLLCCLVLNYGILLLWFIVFRFRHTGLFKLHGKWFRLSEQQFDAIHYGGMAVYKIGILLFNLVPYLALLIVGPYSV